MSEEWASFVAVLAEMPDVVDRLAAEHTSDGAGLCRACTRPGHGTAHMTWPCSLSALAADASRLRRSRPGRTDATA